MKYYLVKLKGLKFINVESFEFTDYYKPYYYIESDSINYPLYNSLGVHLETMFTCEKSNSIIKHFIKRYRERTNCRALMIPSYIAEIISRIRKKNCCDKCTITENEYQKAKQEVINHITTLPYKKPTEEIKDLMRKVGSYDYSIQYEK